MASFAALTTGKIHVGAIPSANLTPSKLIPGLMTVNGPAYFGAVPAIGVDRATVCIGPPLPNAPGLPFSLEVTGLSNFISYCDNAKHSWCFWCCNKVFYGYY